MTGFNPGGGQHQADLQKRENDALAKLVLLQPGLHVPLADDCKCSRTAGTSRMGPCACMFMELCEVPGEDGVPSFCATLAKRRGEWHEDRKLIDAWEDERRMWPANPGRCLRAPGHCPDVARTFPGHLPDISLPEPSVGKG